MIKKYIVSIFISIFCFMLFSCNKNSENESKNKINQSHHFTDNYRTLEYLCRENNICIERPIEYKYHNYINFGYDDRKYDYYVIDSLSHLPKNTEIQMYDVSVNEREFSKIELSIRRFGAMQYVDKKYQINWDAVTSFYAAYNEFNPSSDFNSRYIVILYRSNRNDYVVIVRGI